MSLRNQKFAGKQAGFTLVELIVVMAIMSLMLFFSFPLWKPLVIKTKVSAAASEMQRAIAAISSNHSTAQNAAPYTTAGTNELAAVLSGSSIFRVVSGTGDASTDEKGATTITHELGAPNATVKMEATKLNADGDSALITLDNVNAGACPGFVAALQNSVDKIRINNSDVKTFVDGGARSYDASAAANACTSGDTNKFEITFR